MWYNVIQSIAYNFHRTQGREGANVAKYKKSMETKQKILDTTAALVLEIGYANLNIKDIANHLEMPRSLIYYYYKNLEDIMGELYYDTYQKLSDITAELCQGKDEPILELIVKYILHYRFVIQNAVLRDFFFARPTYVIQGKDAIRNATYTCFTASRKAFEKLRPDASENDLFIFIITCDTLMHTLFKGLANGVLSMSLRDVILYFGKCSVMVNFSVTKEEMERIVDEAFALTDTVPMALSTV